MQIAVISGKGGTGKTTVATNLAVFLSGKGNKITFVDCDVEEPNAHFFLQPVWNKENKQTVPVPSVDNEHCLGETCQKCVQECRFNALIWMVDSVLVFPELCHSCGLCQYLCPAQCISETTREIGIMRSGEARGINISGGLLRIGEAMAPPLIKIIKQNAPPGDIQIIDAPPGTSCPVIESLQGSDFVLVVAEPTPFGLYDLQLTIGLLKKLSFPFGVVINRDGMGNEATFEYLQRENLTIIGRLPHTEEAARSYSKGELLLESLPDFPGRFEEIWQNILTFTQEKTDHITTE